MKGQTIIRLTVACALCVALFVGIAVLIETFRGSAA
jgi:hypothetical protein